MAPAPVFYINIDARTDRRAFMEQQFTALGITAERIAATVPATVPPTLIAAAREPDGSARVSPAEIACTLSHMAAWRHILALGAPAGIVLEDDGILSRRLPEFLHHLGPSLPADIDLLKLETTRRHVRLGSAGRHLAGLAVRRLMGDHVGACGYVVSSVLAAHLLKVMQPASVPVDNILFSRRCTLLYSHRVYQVVPALTVQLVLRDLAGTQEIARSDLAGTRPDHSLPFKATRLRRISSNLRFSWRELNAFGTEVFNARTATPFADDA